MGYKLDFMINDVLKTFYLNKEEVSAGKLPSNDIEISDNTVSRKHCKFVKVGDKYKIIDLNSTNGTFVNGVKVKEKIINDGDNITIGRTILKVSIFEDEVESRINDINDQQISMIVPLSDKFTPFEKEKVVKREELNLLTSLTQLGKNLIASSDIDESFAKVGELIRDYLEPKRLFIFSYDEYQDKLELKYSNDKKYFKKQKIDISRTIAMKAIKEKLAILSSNTKTDERFDGAQSIIMYGITSAISVPIWTKNSIYGLIYADTTITERYFQQRDLEIVSIIANFTGLSIEGINSLNKLNQEKKLRSRLERYHSPSVVSRIMKLQDEKTGEFMPFKELEASVLFMDIVGFTSKTEKMKPIEVGIFLNNFFTEMTEIIFKHNGTLDKYIGDAIMAVFGVPFSMKNHTELSILTALEMLKKLEEMNNGLKVKERTKIRIGINCGKLISGDFGSPKRYDYTVLGNTVNIASRLESAVAHPDEIVVTDSVYKHTKKLFDFEYIGEKKLHGISKPVKVYKVLGKKEEK